MINRTFETVLNLDEHNMVDRQCPKPECNRFFKALFESLEAEEAFDCYCPYCRHAAEASEFRTPDQTSFLSLEAQYMVEEEASKLMRQAFGKSMSFKSSSRNSVTERPVPPDSQPVAGLEYVCRKCGGTTGVQGQGMFCHLCGESQVTHVALQQLAILAQNLSDVGSLRPESDQARTNEIENAFKTSVEILEQVGKHLYPSLAKAKAPYPRGLFQRFVEANQFWMEAGGSDLESLFSPRDLDNFSIYAGTRHVYVHNAGAVDERYLDQTKDRRYKLGDRVAPTIADALDFVRLARIRTLQMISDSGLAPLASEPPSQNARGVPKPSSVSESHWATFVAVCVAAEKADRSNLRNGEVVAELPDVDPEEIGDALELLQSLGFVSLARTADSFPVPLHIKLTQRGLNHYLTHTVPHFALVERQIGSAALDGNTSVQSIADEINTSRLVVDHVLEQFESKGWIASIQWSDGDGLVYVPRKVFLRQLVGKGE